MVGLVSAFGRKGRLAEALSGYQWLVDYAPWLVPPGTLSLDQIRALVLADTVETDSLSNPVVKEPRRRRPRHER